MIDGAVLNERFPQLKDQRGEAGMLDIEAIADAFWTLQMSASILGFGDHFPVTFGGRMIVALLFYIGVGLVGFIGALIADRVLGFADTNVKNRELRKQNAEILDHSLLLEKKIDSLVEQFEMVLKNRS